MNPMLFAWCQEPVIGPLLWIASLCSFPPLLSQISVSLATSGIVLSTQFEAPVRKGYFMSLNYRFASNDDRLKDKLVGASYDVPCYGKDAMKIEDFPESRHAELGKPISLHITIKRVPEGAVVLDRRFASICRADHDGALKKSQILGIIELLPGKYKIEVKNAEARHDLAKLDPTFSIW